MLGNTVLQKPTGHCAHPSFMGGQGEKKREEEARRWRGRKAPLRSHHPNGEDIPLCSWKTRRYSGNTKYSHASVQLHPLLPSLQFFSSSPVFCFRVRKGRNECLLCLLANPEIIRDFIRGGLGCLIPVFFRKTDYLQECVLTAYEQGISLDKVHTSA